ncbi:helix-turn-helix domain-containing protein [Streptomyces sp. NPDC087903]|uniref:helix-turn-helix domain-containing protein n=1 Tax=Streptomyces sp. NPDC087903 TaxID=3365819 RepID=UPI0038160388
MNQFSAGEGEGPWHEAGLSQRALASAATVSRGTVQYAESGTCAPSSAVLEALLGACWAPDHARRDAHDLRNRGRTAARGRRLHAPSAKLIYGRGALAAVLADAYEQASAPSSSAFIRPATGLTPIPRTSLYNIVNRRRLPASREQLETFLAVCRVGRRIAPNRARPTLQSRNSRIRGRSRPSVNCHDEEDNARRSAVALPSRHPRPPVKARPATAVPSRASHVSCRVGQRSIVVGQRRPSFLAPAAQRLRARRRAWRPWPVRQRWTPTARTRSRSRSGPQRSLPRHR